MQWSDWSSDVCSSDLYKFTERYRLIGRFKAVLDTSSIHATNWAHWICESLAVLVWLPPEITQACTVLWIGSRRRPGSFIPESLHFFGFDNTIRVASREYIFTEQLWNLVPFIHNSPYPAIIRRFREELTKRVWLTPIVPSKFILMQRDRRSVRYILNMNEIQKAFVTALPSCDWKVMTYYRSIIVAAKQFYEVKLLFGFHGGGCGSLVFMQKDTIFLEIQSDSCFSYMWELTQICGQYHVMARMDVGHGVRDVVVSMDMIHGMIAFVKRRLTAG
jgi:hypothetical protein